MLRFKSFTKQISFLQCILILKPYCVRGQWVSWNCKSITLHLSAGGVQSCHSGSTGRIHSIMWTAAWMLLGCRNYCPLLLLWGWDSIPPVAPGGSVGQGGTWLCPRTLSKVKELLPCEAKRSIRLFPVLWLVSPSPRWSGGDVLESRPGAEAVVQ